MTSRKYYIRLYITVVGNLSLAVTFLLTPPAIAQDNIERGWKEGFTPAFGIATSALPENWTFESKLGTTPAVFSIETDAGKGFSYLHMEADRASGSLLTLVENVDMQKTPILRWRWRVIVLPEGADGRIREKDDQAIGIYVGTGSLLKNRSVSYRWDTETPKGAQGTCAYGLGTIEIKWYTIRNKEDAKSGQWHTEERNIAEDFYTAWGFYPDEVYVSVSCNSQYTLSRSVADLDGIEFISHTQ